MNIASIPKENKAEKEAIEQTLKVLIYTYGFDPQLSKDAVEAITDKSDVTAAYNWILDQNKVEDRGGPIYPKTDCPHLEKHLKVIPDMLTIENTFQSCCSHYEELERLGGPEPLGDAKGYPFVDDLGNVTCPPGENWKCLECNLTRCSRYVNGHALDHWEKTKEECKDGEGHCIAISLADLSVWCYICQSYVVHDMLDPCVKKLQKLKFSD